ncbi:MAG: hypothetical protein K1X53_06380 [Candidatus Sumerlaeaceae bacterium]|nr:hypothetical protein [Candidatus Sumerlaeaceae bacterium]
MQSVVRTVLGWILLSISTLAGAQPSANPLQVARETTASSRHKAEFSYSDPDAKSVSLAGSFNNWDPQKTAMNRGGEGKFTVELDLAPGTYGYKFVINGDKWVPDPANPESEDDNYGGRNSVLRIPEGGSAGAEQTTVTKPSNKSSPFASVEIEALGRQHNSVTFKYAATQASRVNLAGSFNGWNKEADPMKKEGNVFKATKMLDDDNYTYKFVVDGENWVHDPENPESEDDGHQGQNSVLRIGPGSQIRKSDAREKDDQISSDATYHDPDSISYFNPQADGTLVIKIRTLAHDIGSVSLSVRGASKPLAMVKEYEDERFAFYRLHLTLEQQGLKPGLAGQAEREVKYSFELQDSSVGSRETQYSLGADGLKPGTKAKPFTRKIDPAEIFTTPEWARHVVWYGLFPERFRNGTTANDPQTTHLREWTSHWQTLSNNEKSNPFPNIFNRRYGGDLQGVMEKLPYLKELGVGAIWFNPLFQSDSLHKYDAKDYRHIDEHFGFRGDYAPAAAVEDLMDAKTWTWTKTDQLFLDVVRKCHESGMRVIIDGVFNHTGKSHPAFQDLVRNGEKSRFRGWYNVTDWHKPWAVEQTPFTYEGWFNHGAMPVFHENEKGFVDPTLRQHIFDITRRWMDPNGDGDPSDGIDGWRLDVANEINSEFWREWRKLVKSINPNALIIAEEWDPPQRYLQGDQFDAVMNYANFAKPINRWWTNGGSTSEFAHEVDFYIHSIPLQSQLVMMNMTNSHDTDRLVSMIFNPGREYDRGNRIQDKDKYKSQKPDRATYEKMKGLLPLQFSYPGAPMIYYGDEAGMWGADDPENRKPMIWKDLEPYEKPKENYFMKDVFSAFQRAAAIRNTFAVLARGNFRHLLTQDNLYVYARLIGNECAIVLCNRSDKQQPVSISLPSGTLGRYVDVLRDPAVKVIPGSMARDSRTRVEVGGDAELLDGTDGILDAVLPPFSTIILVKQ